MKHFLLSIGIIFSLFAGAQPNADNFAAKDSNGINQLPIPASKKRISMSMEIGSTFGIANKYGNYFGTYFSPRIQYPLSDKFSIRAGMVITSLSGYDFYSPIENNYYRSQYGGSLVFIEGAYQIHPKVTLTGATFHEIEFDRAADNRFNSTMTNDQYKGIIMGIDYQLNDNVFIQGRVEFSNGRNPYGFSRSLHPAMHPFNNWGF